MYEIPQQLEYKEKIVFGLTFGQIAYAMIFFPIIFPLLFKIQASLVVRIFLASIPSVLAVGFMFFDLSTHLKNWYTWLKTRNLDTKEKLEKALVLGEIKDNLIHHNKKIGGRFSVFSETSMILFDFDADKKWGFLIKKKEGREVGVYGRKEFGCL